MYLIRGIYRADGGHKTAEARDVRIIDGGRGLRGEGGKVVDEVFPRQA